jgi:hypothetical protein
MTSLQIIPLLLGILVGLLLGLVGWGFFRSRNQRVGDTLMEARGDMLAGLSVLAAFALIAFLLYILTGFSF